MINRDMPILTEKDYAHALKESSILVTGATGMIGQNLVRVLLGMNDRWNVGINVIAHARNDEKARTIFQSEIQRNDLSLVVCDIAALKVHNKVDYIVHAAGVTGGSRQHIDYPMRTISVALEGTKIVLDIAREKNSKGIVLLSSLEVYGNTGMDTQYIQESDGGYIDPLNVRSSYSESKRMCECMFASYAKQYGVPATVARLTASFGRGASSSDDRVFAQFAKSILTRSNIVLKTTGETVRDYCDAEDVAFALLAILLRGAPGEAYNVANMNTEISIKDLALKFIELYPENNTSLCFDLSEGAAKFGYNKTMRKVLNSHKLMDLGWCPRYDIEDMIHHLVDSLGKETDLSNKGVIDYGKV